jgi:hypothetical protein
VQNMGHGTALRLSVSSCCCDAASARVPSPTTLVWLWALQMLTVHAHAHAHAPNKQATATKRRQRGTVVVDGEGDGDGVRGSARPPSRPSAWLANGGLRLCGDVVIWPVVSVVRAAGGGPTQCALAVDWPSRLSLAGQARYSLFASSAFSLSSSPPPARNPQGRPVRH